MERPERADRHPVPAACRAPMLPDVKGFGWIGVAGGCQNKRF